MKDEELNVILEQMAEEVPPMPADFHARWMNAVRAEAQGTASAAEDTTQRKTVSLVRWTRILSVAAAFVFLIGGTLLWRSTKQSLSVSAPAEKREAEAVLAAEEDLSMTDGDGSFVEDEDADADLSFQMKAAGAMMNSFAASSEMMAAGAAVPEKEAEEADYAMESACEAAAFEAAEPAPAAAEPAAAPTAAPAATPEPSPEPTVTPEPEKTGFLQDAGAFFSDMGDFLLAALPYLLVLAVPAAAALVIRKKKARK